MSSLDTSARRVLLASLGAALFILSLGAIDPLTRDVVNLPALIPPFGASTVIVFYAPDTAASRPWSVVVGHVGSALVACAVLWLLPGASITTLAALAVVGAGVWMVLSRSIHPPGGATALFTTLGGLERGIAALLLPLIAGCIALVSIRWVLDWGSKRWRQRASFERVVAESLPPQAQGSL